MISSVIVTSAVTIADAKSDQVFTLFTVVVRTDKGRHRLCRRFSSLRTAALRLQSEFASQLRLPSFPPRTLIRYTSSSFVERRRGKLNEYFEDLVHALTHSDVSDVAQRAQDEVVAWLGVRSDEDVKNDHLLALHCLTSGKRALLPKARHMLAGLARERPESPVIWYNLACSESAGGDGGAAVDSLVRAIGAGYHRISYMLTDADLAAARRHPDFEERVLTAARASRKRTKKKKRRVRASPAESSPSRAASPTALVHPETPAPPTVSTASPQLVAAWYAVLAAADDGDKELSPVLHTVCRAAFVACLLFQVSRKLVSKVPDAHALVRHALVRCEAATVSVTDPSVFVLSSVFPSRARDNVFPVRSVDGIKAALAASNGGIAAAADLVAAQRSQYSGSVEALMHPADSEADSDTGGDVSDVDDALERPLSMDLSRLGEGGLLVHERAENRLIKAFASGLVRAPTSDEVVVVPLNVSLESVEVHARQVLEAHVLMRDSSDPASLVSRSGVQYSVEDDFLARSAPDSDRADFHILREGIIPVAGRKCHVVVVDKPLFELERKAVDATRRMTVNELSAVRQTAFQAVDAFVKKRFPSKRRADVDSPALADAVTAALAHGREAAREAAPRGAGTEHQFALMNRSLDVYFFSKMRQRLFVPDERDDRFNKRRAGLRAFVQPSHLGVVESCDQELWGAAAGELELMKSLDPPEEKLECILNCARVLVYQLQSLGSRVR
jgi:hypothetical protein